ncbi:MAG TPA: TonB-dependent receptor [Thermoanaerobaculia bacterium]|nr:TonB-dependent receptor [Thermoanaerobaculia bacterium]
MIFPAALPLLLAAAQGPNPAPPAHEVFRATVTVAERSPRERTDVPAAVATLDRAEIERLPAENLAEALDLLPGFLVLFPEGFGGVPMLQARGFFGAGEAEYVQLRVDGVPVAELESGVADLRAVRAAAVGRIEALRGPGSALYGDTALAGVLDVRTAAPEGASSAGLGLSAGSFGTGAADLALRRPLGAAGAVDLGLDLSVASTDGYRRIGWSDETLGELAASGAAGGGRWRLALAAGERERGEPGPLAAAAAERDPRRSDPLFADDREERSYRRGSLAWDRDRGRIPWRAALYTAERDSTFRRTLLLAAGLGDRAQRELETETVGGSLEVQAPLGAPVDLRLGVEGARDRLDTRYRAVDEQARPGEVVAAAGARRERSAAFLAPSWRAGERARIAAALRYDRVADELAGAAGPPAAEDAWSPRLGVALRLTGETAPLLGFVQAGRAFKAPTLDQRFDPRPFPDFAGGTFEISNPALAPQRAETLEAGLSQAGRRGRWELVAYRTDVEDEIDFDPATFRYVNIGASRHDGVEAALWLLPLGRFRPALTYAWTSAAPSRGPNRGLQLKNIPEHHLRAGLGADLPGRIEAEAWLARHQGRFLDDAHVFPLADATVVDLRLGRSFERWRLRLDLLNLTDERWDGIGYALPDFSGGLVPYVFPAPGFAARLGVELRR